MAIRRDRNGHTHRIDEAAEKPTRKVERPGSDAEPRPHDKPVADDQRTYLSKGRASAVTSEEMADDPMQDPVVGWLVIVDGPGQGSSLCLGYGRNTLGRGKETRIRVDFGDREISRGDHAVITYDPRGRRFYLQHGGGTNLTYLNEQPVLTTMELKGGETIMLGQTRLRFVPFCGEQFDWQDNDR